MRRSRVLLALALLLACMLALPAPALAEVSGAWTYVVHDDGTAGITAYGGPKSDDLDLVVPSELDGHVVTSIDTSLFASSSHHYHSVTFPDTITKLHTYLFHGAYVQEVTLPAHITEIPGNCFFSCHSLRHVTIPEGVTVIGDSAFSYCTSLSSVDLPESLRVIRQSAFEFTLLTDVVIPYGVEKIDTNCFFGCQYLSSVTIPSSVTSINDYAFYKNREYGTSNLVLRIAPGSDVAQLAQGLNPGKAEYNFTISVECLSPSELLDLLPTADDLDYDLVRQVLEAKRVYDEATEEERADVTPEHLALLETLLQMVDEVMAQHDADVAAALAADAEQLPEYEDITLEDEYDIEELVERLDALTEKQLALLPEGVAERIRAAAERIEELHIEYTAHNVHITGGNASTYQAAKGWEVRIMPSTPPSGMVFDTWEVISGDVTTTPVDTVWAFVMPASDVEIRAKWKKKPEPEVTLIPIYRMYNTRTSEHLWTKSKAEYNACGTGNYKDWRQESAAWYSPNLPAPASYAASTQGNYVYVWRLYDRGRTGDHIYLTYGAEMRQYLANGWVVDKGAGFWTVKKGTVVSERSVIPIYRAYNPKLKRGKHHYTPSKNEYDTICKKHGWKPEGTKFYVIKK